ncbi:uncharacterized protein LOC132196703 isoform X2 [Neocloeon triangulifer]|uniref:uncharacterized protein LOC132196703 isoform X2 n=1 Tax=Neocloeon triangulifer TaxID=2078957 RepID=UPI00286EF337|nr:uncharacterized protein LOC132196703 isoform X2 [Neocloeon triangulifer]
MEVTEKLLPLDRDKIPHLLDVLKSLLPDTAAYHWLLTQEKWSEQCKEIKLIVFCLNGNFNGGTMVGLVDNLAVPDKIFGTLYAKEENMEQLKNAILNSELIDWCRFKHFTSILNRMVPFVREIFAEKGVKYLEKHLHLLVMSQEKAANIDLPDLSEEIRVGPLNEHYLDIVCNNWPHYDFQYRPVILKMLQLNHSTGVFVRNAEGEEILASMVLQTEYGGVGILQTLPNYQRKGYAEIATLSLTKILGRQQKIMVHAYVLFQNDKAERLFEKCGFDVIAHVCKMPTIGF